MLGKPPKRAKRMLSNQLFESLLADRTHGKHAGWIFIKLGLVFCFLIGSTASTLLARPAGPTDQDKHITRFVRLLMEQKHLTKQEIDDKMSARCLDMFLKTLDPMKIYFYESDVDEFSRYKTQLDDLISKGDITFSHSVFNRFMARVEERCAYSIQMVDFEHDFTLDETIIRDRDAMEYAKSPEEAHDRWRKRVKFDLLVEIADEVDIEEAKKKLRKRYSSIEKRWEQTSNDELLEMYLSSLTRGFDPHSTYMSPATLDSFTINMRLELDGIGASLRSEDGYTEVHEIIVGGAADKQGMLKKGDQIIGVGQGTDGPIEDVVDLKINDVVKQIRGKRGTIVRLQVKPVSNPKEIVEYTITRDRIELKDQEARSTVVEWGKHADGTPYRVGVINLPSFYLDIEGYRRNVPNYRSTSRDVRRLLEGFQNEGVDAVVVDLRFNGGGSLSEAVDMTGLFIDQGPVVQVQGPDGRPSAHKDEVPGMTWEGPLVVLTNKFSASSSEIFAGAIQDYGRGIVVGDESTHGKGTVQQLYDVSDVIFRFGNKPNWGALKLTIQQFFRPGGDSTQGRGVLSDVTIPSITDHFEGISESEADYALDFSRVRPLPHDRLGMSGGRVGEILQKLSDDRVQHSEEFAKDTQRIARYEEQVAQPTVTLNLEQYMAEREELDAEKDEQEELAEELNTSDKPVYDMEDHYNQEAMSIVIDYVRLLQENKVAIAPKAAR